MNPDSLLRYDKDQKYMIADCETCHLNLVWPDNKPWQWAWLIATQDNILEEHNYYVKWDKLRVSKKARELTGYTDEKIDQFGKSPKEVLDILDSYIYDETYKLVMHNGLNFDAYIHQIHRRACGKKTDYSYLPRFYDSNYLIKGYKRGVQPRPGESLLAYQYRLCNTPMRGIKTSIETLCKEYGFPYSKGAHDAIEDVKMLKPIWKKTLQQVEI